jgi:hypothetical protein
MVFYLKLFENPVSKNAQLAMNKITESTMNEATEDLHSYDESMLIEAIDQPEQIAIANDVNTQNSSLEITEYLIENDISIDNIAEEI